MPEISSRPYRGCVASCVQVAACFRGALIGHTDRVTSLEFCSGGDARDGAGVGELGGCGGGSVLCATGSVDQSVKVWDCESLACLHTLAGQHAKEIAGVSTCRDSSATLVSADKGGIVVIWDYSTGKILKIPALNNTGATCVRCGIGGGAGGVAAVGLVNGTVLIVHVARACVLHRLIGHEGEVHALDWANALSAPLSAPRHAAPDSWEEDSVPASRGGALGGTWASVLVSSSGRDKVFLYMKPSVGSRACLMRSVFFGGKRPKLMSVSCVCGNKMCGNEMPCLNSLSLSLALSLCLSDALSFSHAFSLATRAHIHIFRPCECGRWRRQRLPVLKSLNCLGIVTHTHTHIHIYTHTH